MSLEQIFYLSQSIASIAVVGSLIYLGLQVRGADRSQRAVMQRGRADRASNAALTVANGELARVWQSGEDSYLQHKARTLDQAAFDSYCAGVRSYMSRPGFRAGWRLLASQFGKEFCAFVEAQIAAAPIASHVDIYAEWQKLVQAERAAPKT
jgi:hypothetical protein